MTQWEQLGDVPDTLVTALFVKAVLAVGVMTALLLRRCASHVRYRYINKVIGECRHGAVKWWIGPPESEVLQPEDERMLRSL